jgi:hypothetical protein
MMSAQFRGLLQESGAALPVHQRHSLRRDFATTPENAVSGGLRQVAPARTPGRGAFAAAQSAGTPSQRTVLITSQSARGATVWEPGTVASSESLTGGNANGVTETDDAWPGPASSTQVGLPLPPPSGILAKQIRDYWDMEQRSLAARAARETSAPQSAPRIEQSVQAPATQRETASLTAAQRLQAFVSGQSAAPPDFSGNAFPGKPWDGDNRRPAELRSPRETSFASPAGALDFDFADRLATLLRRQALQHGIDVT